MAYERNYFFDINEGSGAHGKSLDTPIMFSEIFDGVPQFYKGSTIYVQEILTIISQIDIGKEHLVDKDMRWFDPKIYLGTYQLSALLSTPLEPESEGGQGFLTNSAHQIKRYSNYTITADPDTPFGIGDLLRVDNCNFELVGTAIEVAGASVSVQVPRTNVGMMVGIVTNEKAPLRDIAYNQFFKSIGLYYNPGCRGVVLNHRVAVINVVTTDFLPYPNTICQPSGG